MYLSKANKCNVGFKQLLASKICPCDLSESTNLSLKVDELTTRSAKLEIALAETIACINNVNSSTDKQVSNDKGAKVSQGAASSRTSFPVSGSISSNDRQFNVVVYGIDECPTNTIRPAHLKQDYNSVFSIFSGLGVIPDPGTILDCYKCKSQPSRPRLILVKFRSVIHVNQVLANKGSLSSPIFIKPDLSPDERAREAILLKERWALLQKGYGRNMIRIHNNSIFVNNKLYSQIKNSVFQSCNVDLSPPQLPMDQSVFASPMGLQTPLITLVSPDPKSSDNDQQVTRSYMFNEYT